MRKSGFWMWMGCPPIQYLAVNLVGRIREMMEPGVTPLNARIVDRCNTLINKYTYGVIPGSGMSSRLEALFQR